MPQPPTLHESLQSLSISDKAGHRKKKEAVADSWDESASEPDSDPTEASSQLRSPIQSNDYPSAPPPTPSSPSQAMRSFSRSSLAHSRLEVTSPSRLAPDTTSTSPERRPEKSTATASRMIAAGLGLKAPKRTEEQRAYDRAAKENETKRREKEREQKRIEDELREKAKRDIWDG